MNETELQRLLDQLVDGELDSKRRAELLASLDVTADGWRRCALVFLEAQCWQRELGEWARERPAGPAAARSVPSGHGWLAGRPAALWTSFVALAASLVVAFSLGMGWQASRGPAGGTGVPVAEAAGGPSGADPQPSPVPAGAQDAAPEMLALQFPLRSTETPHTVYLPVLDDEPEDRAGLAYNGEVGADSLRRLLEQAGHEVQETKTFWPVQLDDGRQFLVPVHEIELQLAAHREYL